MFLVLIVILAFFATCNATACDHPFTEVPGGKCLFNSRGVLRGTWEEGQRICAWLNQDAHLLEFRSLDEIQDLADHLDPVCLGYFEIDVPDFILTFALISRVFFRCCSSTGLTEERKPSSLRRLEILQWMDAPGHKELPIICEVPPRPKCPAVFTSVGESCYYLGNSSTTWSTAQEICRLLAPNGKLIELETLEEMYSINEFLTNNSPARDYWTGAEERDGEEEYSWTSSGKPVIITNWWGGKGGPDSNSNEGVYLRHNSLWRWASDPKTLTLYELCEADPAEL
ncbi:unnamed protein product [Cyprideis torosa]|uniref:Uncharacterized protein n=1 Tax=Cyprideis torosa TaxID=163714 RepID=A0A7R8WE41_9CRUS|nr:unnamed protein product [Cyprideis torosa]CAG0893922.1 unnamed protein product [Cyprideis torosa]